MLKRIIIAITLLSLVFTIGCEEIASLTGGQAQTSSGQNLKIVKGVELGSEWEMKQMSFKVGAGDEVLILIKLSAGDTADGYFYLEKGEDIDFSITGKSLLHASAIPAGAGSEGVTSDRFSFTATPNEGDTYTLTFRNPADNEEGSRATVSVFLEVIYPVTGSIYVPVDSD